MIFSWLIKKRSDRGVDKVVHKKVGRKEAAEQYVKYGEDMANANRLEEAIEYFDKAIKIEPQNAFAWGDRALILDKQGKMDEALESFSKSVAIDSKNAITWHNKGLTLLRLKRLPEGIECFDKAIEIKEDYAKAWYNKGRALSMIGKIKTSQECFDKARKLDPLLYTKLRRMK
jgi:tetratricopeptide (TPR) repeat protein